MKKVSLLIVVVAFMVNYSNAQELNNGSLNQIHFGLKVGANYSNVYDAKGDQFNADAKFGLATGAFLTIPFAKYFAFQPEVLYSQKGFQATGRILGSTYDFTRTTTFIDVPLLLAVRPSDVITILAGPQFSYLVKQKDVFSNSTTSIDQQKEFDNENIRRNLLCFTGGLDFNLNNIVLGARVGWDISNNNGDGTSSTPRYKNVWYQATLGFRF